MDESDLDLLSTPTPDYDDKMENAEFTLPVGLYHVMLKNVRPGPADQTRHKVLTFEVANGRFKGKLVQEKLFLTEGAANRFKLFCSRLGLSKRNEKGDHVATGKTWADVIGTKVVVKLDHEHFVDKKDKNRTKNIIDYAGVYRADDPAVADAVRDGFTPVAEGGGGKGSGGKREKAGAGAAAVASADTFDDI